MENEERAHQDAHFQGELNALKESVARLTGLLEQALRNASGEGPSNRPAQTTNNPDKVTGERIQDPPQPPAVVQSAAPAPVPVPPFETFANDSHKTQLSDDTDHDKMAVLEARIRAIEGVDLYDPVRAVEMCLVPNVVIPKKFRVPDFIKYTGTQCPVTHLRSYCNKMAEVVHDEKLLMHFFQDSLNGPALSWYMRLDNTRIRSWKDLVDAFVKQYKYNMDIAPDRTSLSSLEKAEKESIREYAQRWRDLAAQVHPPLLDREMVTLFANTLKAPFYEHVMGSSAQQFTDAVAVAERIEQGIKNGRISAPVEKKGFVGKKREIDNIETGYRGRNIQYSNSSSQIANVSFKPPYPTKRPGNQAENVPKNQTEGFPKANRPRIQEQLPPLPLPLDEIYQKLLSIGLVAPVPLIPLQPPYPSWYRPDLTCEYHAGIAGHGIHTCNAFKRKLLHLLKTGWMTFEDSPNVSTNPLPSHASGSGSVNMLDVEHPKKLRVPIERIYQMLTKAGYSGIKCCQHFDQKSHFISQCPGFYENVMQLMNRGLLRIETMTRDEIAVTEMLNQEVCRVQITPGGLPKLILTKPRVTPKEDYNAIPYNYGNSSRGVKQPFVISSEIGGLTRSGRCFTPEELRKIKGKEVIDVSEETNQPVTEEETNEFLKLMKHSEYDIVEQLKRTPAKISLLSLVLNSESHRKALQKVLNEAYVPQDINPDAMGHLVGRIQASNYVYFSDDEIDLEGTGHNKPLYITVRCKDVLIGKVLVDNGSALNVLPKHMLKEMPLDESHIKPSTMMARAYDGSPRQVVGTIEVELYIGPQLFFVTLQVMDIHPSYSMLLGRPWIHAARAIPSSLHQCLKYIANGMLVTVKAEETISMVKNVAVPFIETETCKDGNVHAFEVVNAEWILEGAPLRKPKIPEAAKMVAKCFLQNKIPFQFDPVSGMPERVNLIKLKCADQRFGLGYKPRKEDFKRVAQIRRETRMAKIEGRESKDEDLVIPPLHESFCSSTKIIKDGMRDLHVGTLEYQEEEADFPQLSIYNIDTPSAKTFVRKLAEGEVFQNWKMEPIHVIFKK